MIAKKVAVFGFYYIFEETIYDRYNFISYFDFAANRCDPAMEL